MQARADWPLRRMLTASTAARVALARRLGMGLREVEAAELVMVAAADPVDPRPIGPVELAGMLGVTTAASTQVLHRLEQDGHVQRLPHPVDGRRRVLQVTDSGAAHVMGQLLPMLQQVSEVTDRLTPAERDVVRRYLEQVTEVFERYARDDAGPTA